MIRAGAAALGLVWTGCDSEDVCRPSTSLALRNALKRMTLEHKPGIAIRLTLDKIKRHCPGHVLLWLIDQNLSSIHEMFAEIVFVCLESDVIQDQLTGANPGHNVLLFDTDGRVGGGFRMDFSDVEEIPHFPAKAVRLARGPGDARLKARAAALRRKTNPALLRTLDRLGRDEKSLFVDKAALLGDAGKIVPLLVEARIAAATKSRQDELRDILDLYFYAPDPAASGPQIPFGVEAAFYARGGGERCAEREFEAGADDCNLGRLRPGTRVFVKYLVQ
jgi:hypothetical protein